MNNNEKEDDIYNIFVGGEFYGEVSESDNEDYPKEFLEDRSASSHITYMKNNMTNIE